MSNEAVDIYNQGYYYYTGSEGFPLNYNKAFEYFQKAADLGVSDAMNYLGVFYESGEIVQKNIELAIDWFYRAIQADPENAHAMFNLGCIYYSGNGVAQDIEKAYRFFKASADLGSDSMDSVYPESCLYIGLILMNDYKNGQEAYPYFLDAAEYGNYPEAWHNLGWLSEQGAIPLDNPGRNADAKRDSMARRFYEKAAELGFAQSMDSLGRLYVKYQMRPEGMQWIEKAASMGYEPAKKRLRLLSSKSIWDLFK